MVKGSFMVEFKHQIYWSPEKVKITLLEISSNKKIENKNFISLSTGGLDVAVSSISYSQQAIKLTQYFFLNL